MRIQLIDCVFEIQSQLGVDHQRSIKLWMSQSNRTGNQQKASAAKLLSEQPIMTTVSMARVTYDRVGHVIEVAPDLMTPSGFGKYFYK